MLIRRSFGLFVTFVALGLGVSSFADNNTDTDTGKKLLAEGDALADKNQTTDAQLRYKQAFELLLPGMRKIPFKHEVKRDVTAREELKTVLIKEFEEDMTPSEFRAQECGMKALGFIPLDLDYKELMVRVYADEIAAFYDPKTKTMHLIREPEVKDKKPASFLQRLLGKKSGFDKDENKTVIAHELTHALADQNYGLKALQDAIKDDDDRELALASLIEGEATLTMLAAQMDDWKGEQISKLPAADLDRTFGFFMPLLPMFGSAGLRDAPAILKESMLFPYIRGLVFCAKQTNDHGWQGIDDAYRQPPLSTEQILHPEKYRLSPDAPMAIDLGKLDAGPDWKELGQNVVGEMQLAVLLRKYSGKTAAMGWDGDRFAVFEGPEKRLGLVWLSTWDDEAEAKEFAKQYIKFQTTKLGEDAASPNEFPDALHREARGGLFTVERRGADVAVVEGFPRDITTTLVEAAFNAKKTEKAHASASKSK
jgi:hypothetical protein